MILLAVIINKLIIILKNKNNKNSVTNNIYYIGKYAQNLFKNELFIN